MSRTRISRDLGPLPSFKGLKSTQDKTGSLLQVLRSLALKNQREQPRVFYSLREVAKKFRVPVSTVAKAYHDMEQEGLLGRVRGSKTVLNGLRYKRQMSVRAFVGLPVLLSHFIAIPEYRTFFISIRHELWLRGFAATMFFFRPDEAPTGVLVERLKAHNVDTVIWFAPGRSAYESVLRLMDMGIRVVIISQVGTPAMPSRYYVWRERGIHALLQEWKTRYSVRHLTIALSKDYRSPVTEELLRVEVDNLEIKYSVETLQNQDSSAFLGNLRQVKTEGIVFPSASLLSMLAFQTPKELTDVLTTQRVGFLDGPIDMPFVQIPDAQVDLVTFDWQTVVELIVNDLITREAFERGRFTTFDAQERFRVSLSNFCEEMLPTRGIGAAV